MSASLEMLAGGKEGHTTPAGQGRKSAFIERLLCVRPLAGHKCYPTSGLIIAVAPLGRLQEVNYFGQGQSCSKGEHEICVRGTY